VRRADDIPALVTRAFTELRGGRPRPVALELPPDVLAARTGAGTGEYAEPSPVLPSDADVERAARLLLAAERPLIYVGGGVLAAGASPALTELAEVLEAPVLVSENARGAIDARHRLAFDGLALRAFRPDADLVLGVGTRFMTTFGRQIDVGRAALVLLNADPADLGEPRAAELAIHADAGLGLRALAAAVGSPRRGSREDEFEQVRKWLEDCLADITPQREYLAAIRSALPMTACSSGVHPGGLRASVCFPQPTRAAISALATDALVTASPTHPRAKAAGPVPRGHLGHR
jgi:acetolactate synthase-1/2/3 large subunit